jgi:CheY-like chemotaxis protein
MKILFLEDNESRVRKARQRLNNCDVVFVATAAEALTALVAHSPFDVAALDHDLGGQIMVESDENSGYAVACAIRDLAPELWPRKVVIHSFNPTGSEKMMSAIQETWRVKSDREPIELLRALFDSEPFWQALGVGKPGPT